MSKLVLTEQQDDVMIITLNRPERHNSLIPELLDELLAAFASVTQDMRAVTFMAIGRSFSTGGDVSGFYQHRTDISRYASRIVGLLNEAIIAMLTLPVPIVTAVQGIVTGGSIGLVLASDIVFASPKASFTPYYAVVGLSPDGGWSALMPKVIGKQRTADALLSNRTISADQALYWGLVSRIVPQDKVQSAAVEQAKHIAGMKPGSICHSKQLLNNDMASIVKDLERERKHFVDQVITDEATTGIENFLSRQP